MSATMTAQAHTPWPALYPHLRLLRWIVSIMHNALTQRARFVYEQANACARGHAVCPICSMSNCPHLRDTRGRGCLGIHQRSIIGGQIGARHGCAVNIQH